MNRNPHQRQLSIGEFSAATQLSAKALRLYDEHGLLRPSAVDATTGYRYYSHEQIVAARLIRTLRDMNLSLAKIGEVIAADSIGAERLLQECLQDAERRFAKERKAFHSALLLLRAPARPAAPQIDSIVYGPVVTLFRAFTTDQERFARHLLAAVRDAKALARQAGLTPDAPALCALSSPLSSDESQLEVLLPITAPEKLPEDIILKSLPSRAYARVAIGSASSDAREITQAIDAVFDWFDRHGCRAVDCPLLAIPAMENPASWTLLWAFEPPT